jgi:hypothetical protein
MKCKVALAKYHTSLHHIAISEFEAEYTSAIIETEFVDVDFPMLAPEAVAAAEIEALDKKRGEVVEEFTRKLTAIDARKAELLALPAAQERSELAELGV